MLHLVSCTMCVYELLFLFFFLGLKFIDCKATRAEGIQARKKETNAVPKTKTSAGPDIKKKTKKN